MNTDHSVPPLRDLPPNRLGERRRHLVAECERQPEAHSTRRIAVAVVVALAIAGATVGAIEATKANGTQPGPPVPANLATAHVSASGFAGSGIWALTQSGLQLSPSHGGGWHDVTPAGVQAGLIRSAYFADSSSGWLAAYGQTRSDGAASLIVYRTTDGGASWQSATVATSTLLASSEQGPTWLTFANRSDGWLEVQTNSSSNFSNANLYRTTDGGANWTALQIPIAGAITFPSSKDGFVSGGATGSDLYVTHDGGTSWQAVKLPGPTGAVYGPVFTTRTAGVLSVTSSDASGVMVDVYRTNDGGAAWTATDHLALAASREGASTPVALVKGGWLAAAGPGGAFARNRGGSSPSTFTASGLPSAQLGSIATLRFRSGSASGLALFNGTVCEGYKTDCIQFGALYSTGDGGSTWKQLSP